MIKVTAPPTRAVRLSSTSGTVVLLEAGQSQMVQPMFAAQAAEKGCSVDHAGSEAAETDAALGAIRQESIVAAVKAMLVEGDPDKFTDAGAPRKPAVVEQLGNEFGSVTAAEIKAAYEMAMEELEAETADEQGGGSAEGGLDRED